VTNLPRLYTLPAAKAELKRLGADVSIDTLRREIRRGRLRGTRIGRKQFIRADHLQDYLSCPDQSEQAPSVDTGSASARTLPSGCNLVRSRHSTNATRIAWHNGFSASRASARRLRFAARQANG
jgi:hypothetical protein